MPFLRAALRKKQEAVQEELLRPPVVVPAEEIEIEPELPEPTTIAELHSLIDKRTEESEFEPETVQHEPEIPTETENETLTEEPATVEGGEPEAFTGEDKILPEESVEVVSVEGEESDVLPGESVEAVSAKVESSDALQEEAIEPANLEDESYETVPGESVEVVSVEGEESDVLPGESVEPVSAEVESSDALKEEAIEPSIVESESPEIVPEKPTEPVSVEGEESDALPNEPTEPASNESENPETLTDESVDEPSSVGGGKFDGSELKYDFTSGERYVDKVSTKTDFDKMLDELAAISKDLLSWEAEKFAKEYTGRFNEGNDSSQADARKYEAFLGGYITNAAMLLYDKGYREAAIKQLEQAKSILEARKKLEDETSAIKSRVEEQNDTVDLSDILGLFGDG